MKGEFEMSFFIEGMKKNIFYQNRYAIDLYGDPIDIACAKFRSSCEKKLRKKGYTPSMINTQMYEYLEFYKLVQAKDHVCRKLWNADN